MKQYALSIGVLMLGLVLIGGGCAKGNDANETSEPTQMMEENQDNNAMLPANTIAAGAYTVNVEASTLGWFGNKIVGGSHSGTVSLKEGEVTVDESGNLSGGSFVIDMSTIAGDEGEPQMVITHLKSDDFFAVETYPEATFSLKSGERQADGSYRVVGDLTIKGITNEITFDARLTQETAADVSATAEFEIDRTLWDVRYGSGKFFQDLGDNVINDNMRLTLDLVATNPDTPEEVMEEPAMEVEGEGEVQVEVLGVDTDSDIQIEVVE